MLRNILIIIGLAAACLILLNPIAECRGRGGFALGGRGFGGAEFRTGAVHGPFGGGGFSQAYRSNPIVGPRGGVGQTFSGSGSYTTGRGTQIDYGGAGVGMRGPFGGAAGRGVGGVQVTTPGGQTFDRYGRAGGAIGPGGYAVGGRSGVGYTTGPYGTGFGRYQGGVAIGPHGAVAGESRAGIATGPGGRTVAGASRGGVAVGPYGAVAGGSRAVAGVGPGGVYAAGTRRYGTYYASPTALRTQGVYVRNNFRYYNTFTPTWFRRYPGAWYIPAWSTAHFWAVPAWSTVAVYCSFPPTPIYYDFGTTVVYQGDTVYVNGEPAATAQQYTQQAEQIAAAGKAAKVSDNADDWQPLGVFALVQGDDTTSYNIFQLALNRQGIIRGNYYNALTDSTEPVYGSVDRKTQLAAWSVGNKKTPLYEAGIANLTKEQTPVLVHFGEGKTEQLTLVHIEKKEEKK